MDETDEALMLAVANKDEGAFASLVQRHLDTLYNYALRMCRSHALAEDLVQDTWLTVWQKAATYKPHKVKPTTWLHRVLYNKFIDHMRRNKSTDALSSVGEQAAPHQPLEEEDGHRLDSALSSLPANQRAAILLKHAQGFSNADIAKIMGASVRAVESLQARARRTLKSSLEASAAREELDE